MEFDVKRCYSAVNADELKVGSKVICADTISDLKYKIKENIITGILGKIMPASNKFRFGIGESYFMLAYLIEEPSELKDQLESYEGYINNIPLIIDPCKMCKVYKANNGYEIENYNSLGEFENGTCTECCWYYDSKFKVGV